MPGAIAIAFDSSILSKSIRRSSPATFQTKCFMTGACTIGCATDLASARITLSINISLWKFMACARTMGGLVPATSTFSEPCCDSVCNGSGVNGATRLKSTDRSSFRYEEAGLQVICKPAPLPSNSGSYLTTAHSCPEGCQGRLQSPSRQYN